MEFQFGYDRWYRWMAAPLGLGPKRASIRLSDNDLHVSLGWAFEADIPLASVVEIGPGSRAIDGWGVRGRRGAWFVNGSSNDIVDIAIDPPVQARTSRRRVELRVLHVSVSSPDAFIEAVRARSRRRSAE